MGTGASVVVVSGPQSTGSVVVVCGLSCSEAYRIFPGQGLDLCRLHWQAESYPPKVHSASPCKVPMPLWTWILLKVHSLWLGCHMLCFALFSCCQLDAVKYYAAQVKCVTQRALTELIPIGCTHPSPFNQ